jgi:hypothetical protein
MVVAVRRKPDRMKLRYPKSNNAVKYYESQLDYINTKLLVREVPIEFKFKDGERRSLRWTIRGDHATNSSYCLACGGAIPSIPQLSIQKMGNICAICMMKLADEAKIQAGKIDPDILEHYTTDRFLRSM